MMPSFRQKFVGFIRQLSNTSDSARDNDVPDNASECFIQNYLKGSDKVNKNEPVILHGKKPYEIPPLNIGVYDTTDIKAADTGPDGGLVSVNKQEDKNGNSIIAGVNNWDNAHERAYGKSCSLYEVHPITDLRAGDPIADCYGILVRGNSAIIALADGVNWGVKASIAAKAAVHGSIDYMNQHLFEMASPKPTTTTEVFTSLLRSFHTAHSLILQEKGMLTTLTTAVVLPLADLAGKYIVCSCNVGDSLAYVYSSKYGVRELTQGSHDVHQMRDMRDALGALGPVDGQNPELSNLTLSMTEVEEGDIVFLTSDGVSDNLDPVVGKFTGLPTVEAHQRHKLLLLRTEDLLRFGVSGKGPCIASARQLVTLLLDFVCRLTAAKRHVLEDRDLYTGRDGVVLSPSEQVARRREVCKRLHAIPGKLDHATVVAYSVGEFVEGGTLEIGENQGNEVLREDKEERLTKDKEENLRQEKGDRLIEENLRQEKGDRLIEEKKEHLREDKEEKLGEKVRVVERVVGKKENVLIEEKRDEKKSKSNEGKHAKKVGGESRKRIDSREERLRERREKSVKGSEREKGVKGCDGEKKENVKGAEGGRLEEARDQEGTIEASKAEDKVKGKFMDNFGVSEEGDGVMEDKEEVVNESEGKERDRSKKGEESSKVEVEKSERRIEGERRGTNKSKNVNKEEKVSKFQKEREPLKGRDGKLPSEGKQGGTSNVKNETRNIDAKSIDTRSIDAKRIDTSIESKENLEADT